MHIPAGFIRETGAMADAKPLYETYNRSPIVFERGHGVWLETPAGERYLDFAAGIAVNSLGHTHPHLVEALKAQADKSVAPFQSARNSRSDPARRTAD
jgi:acetylornithine/succinyldiaminopimelate/putrescine aminotransferase